MLCLLSQLAMDTMALVFWITHGGRMGSHSRTELIAGLLMGIVALTLLLPWILFVRSMSREQLCLRNLKHLGVALASYHDTHNHFPPAAVWIGEGESLGDGELPIGVIDHVFEGEVGGRMATNWVVALLPHLNEVELADMFVPEVGVGSEFNARGRETSVDILLCPSDPHNTNSYLRGPGLQNQYARGNYALNMGPDRLCMQEVDPDGCPGGFHVDSPDLLNENRQMWGSGLGGYNKAFSMADVTAGASNVIHVDEIRSGPHDRDSRGVWALGFIGSSVTAAHGLSDRGEGSVQDAAGPNNQYMHADDIVGCEAVLNQMGREYLIDVGMPCAPGTNTANQATARSMHEAGVHVLRCDGSADFVSDNVGPEIWYTTHTRDGRNLVEAALPVE